MEQVKIKGLQDSEREIDLEDDNTDSFINNSLKQNKMSNENPKNIKLHSKEGSQKKFKEANIEKVKKIFFKQVRANMKIKI